MAMLILRCFLAAGFLFAGYVHLVKPQFFMPIMPPWIPFHSACILISGLCEIAGGIALLIPHPLIQWWTGIGLTALLFAVFPANIYMAVAHIKINGIPSHQWMAWARLPLQPILMVGVIWVTGIWPKSGS